MSKGNMEIRKSTREDIKQMLIRAIDDIVENCTLDNGLFYYKELPSLSRNGNNTCLLYTSPSPRD